MRAMPGQVSSGRIDAALTIVKQASDRDLLSQLAEEGDAVSERYSGGFAF
ncbi:hypothetical protein FHS95_003066 [Sphingomonas naasensis]|nr:hypothetical protein [Sphingomonas naasensis]NIJ21363.1 hypothetical protein [Sphingomonas naasensis]